MAVSSAKGGVGKSTVAVNLAGALALDGAKVGLMDADVYGPNVPLMLGTGYDQPEVVNGQLKPIEAHGIKMISMGLLVKPGQPLIWRGPMLNSAIRQFLSDVEWGELDYLIVDLPPGTGDAALSLAQALPLSGAVIVTLPQLVSLEDAGRGRAAGARPCDRLLRPLRSPGGAGLLAEDGRRYGQQPVPGDAAAAPSRGHGSRRGRFAKYPFRPGDRDIRFQDFVVGHGIDRAG